MDYIIKYRKDIDGLRALSVLIVIFFHYGIPGFSGGFVGVDVFFVISGYLISAIILKELAAGNFSFLKFYERRVRRILPALFFIILFTLVFGYFLFDFHAFKYLGRSVVSTSVFSSNLYFYFILKDYFAPQNNPLLHTWSLAVEEQFYIFFPVFLLLIYKFSRKYLKYYLIGAAIVSFIFCVVIVNHNQPLSFYSPMSRAWQLLAGVLLSVNLFPNMKNKIWNEILALLGLILILIAQFTLSDAVLYPGVNALLPIVGACLIIYTGKEPGTTVNKLLSLRPIVFIGQISYSLYLWHWVLLIALKTIIVGPLTPIELTILFAITFLISFLSWRFVEQPFRTKQIFAKRNKLFLAAAIVNLFLLGFGIYLFKSNGMHSRRLKNKMMAEIEKNEHDWQALDKFDKATVKLKTTGILLKGGDTTVKPTYLLWGDSHSKALFAGVDTAAKENHVSIYFAAAQGTPPMVGVQKFNRKPSGFIIADNVIKFLKAHPDIKTVFLAARWNYYANNHDCTIIQSDSSKKSGINENRKIFEKGLIRTVKAIRALNKQVVIITDVPDMEAKPFVYMNEKNIFYPHKPLNELTPDTAAYYNLNRGVLKLFDRLKQDSLIKIITVQDQFFANNKFMIEDNNHFLFRDENHLSYYGSIKLKNIWLSCLK